MQDPFAQDVNLQNVETTLPLIPDGDYVLQCVESAVEPNKEQSGWNWKLKLVTTEPVTAVDGRPVNPGFPVFVTQACQAKADSKDPEAFKRGLAETIDALYASTKEDRQPFAKPAVEGAIGKLVKGTIYMDEYPVGSGNKNNKVRRLKKVD
jgi:hypothetical protein